MIYHFNPTKLIHFHLSIEVPIPTTRKHQHFQSRQFYSALTKDISFLYFFKKVIP